MRNMILIAHNLRSCHNVGSLLRTADGLGVSRVFLTGYTPYPEQTSDSRLPHIRQKVHKQIHKTALGAEAAQPWQYSDDIVAVIQMLKQGSYTVAALEQTAQSKDISTYQPPENIALIVGREVEGIESEILQLCDYSLFIPMFGSKESFNVVQAAAMALYHFRFSP